MGTAGHVRPHAGSIGHGERGVGGVVGAGRGRTQAAALTTVMAAPPRRGSSGATASPGGARLREPPRGWSRPHPLPPPGRAWTVGDIISPVQSCDKHNLSNINLVVSAT